MLDALGRYVRNGGVLVVGPESLRLDDRFGEAIDPSALLGGRFGDAVTRQETVRFRMDDVPTGKTYPLHGLHKEEEDAGKRVYGYTFTPGEARTLAQTAGGQTAVAVHALGKGAVYTLAREFTPTEPVGPSVRGALLRWIASRHGLVPPVAVAFEGEGQSDLVETHLFGKSGSQVVYAMNHGAKRSARLIPRIDLPAADGRVTVRDVQTGRYLGPGGAVGRMAWERADLERGIEVTLPTQEPTVLLVEDAAREPLPFRHLTAEQERELPRLYRPNPTAGPRVLIDVDENQPLAIPTAVSLLQDNGFRVVPREREELPPDTKVFAFIGAAKAQDIVAALREVERGAGLLLCARRSGTDPDPWPSLKTMGIRFLPGCVHDPKHHILDEEKYVMLDRIARHPVTVGVRTFQSTGIRALDLRESRAYALAQAGDSAFARGPNGEAVKDTALPVVGALLYGKGRIVVVGGDTWLRPDDLELGDNRRLLLNAVQWLAGGGGDVAYVPPAALNVDEREFAPRVTPAEIVQEWDFERGGITWQFARPASDTAHSGKRSILAGASTANAAYDVVVRTTWQKDGLLDLPEDPHVNFAYHADKAARITVRLEIGKRSAHTQFEAKVGAWAFVSLPINRFEDAVGDQANLRLMEIQIVAGKKGDGVTLHLDDVSISKGKHGP